MINKLITAIIAAVFCSYAWSSPQERCFILGDSINAFVVEQAGVIPAAKNLAANLIVQKRNVQLYNLSSPAMTMAPNGTGMDAYTNKNSIKMLTGYFGAKCIVITLGTNDWTNPEITTSSFFDSYKAVVSYAVAQGLRVVCVTPIWRSNQDDYQPSGDSSYQLWVYRWIAESACSQGGGEVIDGASAPLLPAHYADGLHLNSQGHAVLATWLIDRMNNLGLWLDTY